MHCTCFTVAVFCNATWEKASVFGITQARRMNILKLCVTFSCGMSQPFVAATEKMSVSNVSIGGRCICHIGRPSSTAEVRLENSSLGSGSMGVVFVVLLYGKMWF